MKSIRWQLPLSYAAIALLAALAIGALMLARLNEYYTQRERAFMENNASAIQVSLMPLPLSSLSADVLEAQVNSLALFARSRVRLYGAGEVLLADSGDISMLPSEIRFLSLPDNMMSVQGGSGMTSIIFVNSTMDEMGAASETIEMPIGVGTVTTAGGMFEFPSTVVGEASVQVWQPVNAYSSTMVTTDLPMFSVFPAGSLGEEDVLLGRSEQSVSVPLVDLNGQNLGRIVLSEGPAYGREIVNSAAQAWLIAGAVGVLLAALAGWLISRRMTGPVLALAQVTGRMAEGDLSARAAAFQTREFDHLGRAFNQMAERVEGTVFTLRSFAADAAHELKTPLTALRTNMELAQTSSQPERQLEYLERSQAQVQHLEHLVTDLLDLARLESGTLKLQPVDLNNLLREAGEIYAARAEQAGLSFVLDLPETDLPLQADSAQLLLAVGNLLDNAIKFTPAGGEVRLGARQTSLWVEDSGPGIANEDMAQLFGRFHRGRNASAIPGSGLGLAIVRAVALAHGGRVQVENCPLGGARFEILFGVKD